MVERRALFRVDAGYDERFLASIQDGGRKSFSLDVENVVQKGITKGIQQAASVAVVAYCGAKPRFQLVYFSFIRVTKVWRTSEAISGINIQDLEDGEKPEKVREVLFRLLSEGVTHSGAGDLKALGISTYESSKHNIIHLDITKVLSDEKGPIGLCCQSKKSQAKLNLK